MKTFMENSGFNLSNPNGYKSVCAIGWGTPEEYKKIINETTQTTTRSSPTLDANILMIPFMKIINTICRVAIKKIVEASNGTITEKKAKIIMTEVFGLTTYKK
jgi:hypothetical protein